MAFGQVGGEGTYRFLDLTTSARSAALGGYQVALDDNDLDLVFHNPALLRDTMRNQLVLNYVDYFSDIKFGYASYAWHLNKIGTVATGITSTLSTTENSSKPAKMAPLPVLSGQPSML